ncbi:MAG: hypothetical protein OMM_15051, partial [Candidatus Magnetoglobus multicellularis str. Araruama]
RDSLGNLLPSGGKIVFAIAYDISHKLVEKVKVSQDGRFTFTKLDSQGSYRLYFRPVGMSGFSREYAGSKVGDYYEGTGSWDDAQEFQTQSVVHFQFSEGEW